MFQLTTATKRIARQKKRVRLNAGGTSAGKTISILQLLIDDAQTDVSPTLTSVVSESFPHLRRGCVRDFQNIMQQHGYWEDKRWSKSEFTYDFPLIDPDHNNMIVKNSGSLLEFFSSDQPGKVRGPRRDRLYCNEVNNIPLEAWEQLLLRTRQYAYADWNPVADFYMYELYGLHDEGKVGADDIDADFQILTYKDNEALEPSIINEIEKRRDNKAWFRPYGLGLRGELEGRIFTDWKMIDDVPHEARLEIRGMDFGYAADPTVLVDIYYYNGGYIIDELVYRTNYLDTDLGTFINNHPNPNTLIIGDSADKQKLVMLQNMGINIIGVEKRGSGGDTFTNSAIKFVQGERISVTKRSTNVIKSYRNFMWQTDREGIIKSNPPKYDHYMSDGMMAVVYGMTHFNLLNRREKEEAEPYMTGNITSMWS
jgi:phage terminase large subunit